MYEAEEAFVTGTFGGLTPVREIDGRVIGDGGGAGPMTQRLTELYRSAIEADVAARAAGAARTARTMTLRINMWSSPRNLSTAMMYAWRQRADTTVLDEPLYAHYLRVTGRDHPGAADVLAAMEQDGETVVRDVLFAEYPTPVVFFKQMAKHLVDIDRSFLPRCRNILLTRDPHDMLTSFQIQVPDATLDDTGFPEMIEILDTLLAAGEEPVVIDTRILLADPPRVLAELCRRLGIDVRPGDAQLARRPQARGRRVGARTGTTPSTGRPAGSPTSTSTPTCSPASSPPTSSPSPSTNASSPTASCDGSGQTTTVTSTTCGVGRSR